VQPIKEQPPSYRVGVIVREDELLERVGALLNISYDYEETNGAAAAVQGAAMLGRLPPALLEEIRDATLAGDKSLLDKIIGKVRENGDAASAQALQELADTYDYDALKELLGAEQ